MMKLSPIVLFVYNRPIHTAQTLHALMKNGLADQSTLYIYADGPKHLASKEELQNINEVRKLIRSEQWCKEVHIIETEHNKGLADSIVKGVTEVIARHGKVIVLEDDIIPSEGFLQYMNDALHIYQDDEKVMHVSGYMYPAKFKAEATTFFLKILSCWGWGTWRRSWDLYNHDIQEHLNYFGRSRKSKKEFDIEGNAHFFSQLLWNKEGRIYSWAVRWYASWLKADGYSLFPAKSLVRNIGHDDSGVHCNTNQIYDTDTADSIEINPQKVEEAIHIRKAVDIFFKQNFKNNTSVLKNPKLIPFNLGAGIIKKSLRWCFRLVYPELDILTSIYENTGMHNATASAMARVYRPYQFLNSSIQDYSYIAMNSRVANTEIGKFCSIGPNFLCGCGTHPFDCLTTSPMFYSTMKQNGITLSSTDKVSEHRSIKIGNDVFIGMNVTVLDGVTIGDGAVIGAGAVVSKDIPSYAIAAGNPINILRYRFDEKTINGLLSIRWWDWPVEKLETVEKHFFDVEKFVKIYGSGKA